MRFSVALAMCGPEHYLPLARAAEEAGFHSIAVPDGPFYPEVVSADYPYSSDGSRFWPADTPMLDPWVTIPAMAAVTERLRFQTMVLKLPIRQPLLVARTVGSAAVLSGNRVELGVGLSWMPEEFEFLSEDFDTRAARTDEAIGIIRALLAGGMVEHHGTHYDFERLQIAPAPTEPVPIIVGGTTRAALRRAARLGDGWVSSGNTTEEAAGLIARLHELLAAEGRDPEGFAVKVVSTDAFDLDGYRRLADVGATEVITQPWWLYGGDPEDVGVRVDALHRFGDEVIARA
jgi:probable F420-dependent oxidoreductase